MRSCALKSVASLTINLSSFYMSQVRITTDNLLQVATQMNNWTNTMKGIVSNMKNSVNNMKDWNDPRAEQFRQQATMTAQQLTLNIDNFTKIAGFLQKYAKMQEEAERSQRERMNNL